MRYPDPYPARPRWFQVIRNPFIILLMVFAFALGTVVQAIEHTAEWFHG